MVDVTHKKSVPETPHDPRRKTGVSSRLSVGRYTTEQKTKTQEKEEKTTKTTEKKPTSAPKHRQMPNIKQKTNKDVAGLI